MIECHEVADQLLDLAANVVHDLSTMNLPPGPLVGPPSLGTDLARHLDRDVLDAFCHHHGIRRLSLFGSTLRGTARSDSDIDLLVEFEPGRVPGLLSIAAMEAELRDRLDGGAVDLRTAADLSLYFRDDVVRDSAVVDRR